LVWFFGWLFGWLVWFICFTVAVGWLPTFGWLHVWLRFTVYGLVCYTRLRFTLRLVGLFAVTLQFGLRWLVVTLHLRFTFTRSRLHVWTTFVVTHCFPRLQLFWITLCRLQLRYGFGCIQVGCGLVGRFGHTFGSRILPFAPVSSTFCTRLVWLAWLDSWLVGSVTILRAVCTLQFSTFAHTRCTHTFPQVYTQFFTPHTHTHTAARFTHTHCPHGSTRLVHFARFVWFTPFGSFSSQVACRFQLVVYVYTRYAVFGWVGSRLVPRSLPAFSWFTGWTDRF